MKHLRWLVLVIPLVLFAVIVEAGNYKVVSVNVFSATTPVLVIPATQKASWQIKPRSAATTMLCWTFPPPNATPTGPMPSAGAMEITAGSSWSDADWGYTQLTDPTTFQNGVACLPEATPASTIIIDGAYK